MSKWVDVERVRGVEELTFEGCFLYLLMVRSEQKKIIRNIRTPLNIIYTGSIPSIKRLYGPKLFIVFIKEGWAPLISHSFDPGDWLLLSDIRVLKLYCVTVYVYHVRFIKLEELIIHIKDVPNNFPIMETVEINLSARAESPPNIKANRLLHLSIFYTQDDHFDASILIQRSTVSQDWIILY
jgi:hypothetical protein